MTAGAKETILQAVDKLHPQILAQREEAETLRRLPPELAAAMDSAGVFRLLLPNAAGGSELPPLDAFEIIERISIADGSAGWCAMIGSAISCLASWMPVASLTKMAGSAGDFRPAGSIRPSGSARRGEGGYRMTGHFNFASGVHHANWLYCPCF